MVGMAGALGHCMRIILDSGNRHRRAVRMAVLYNAIASLFTVRF